MDRVKIFKGDWKSGVIQDRSYSLEITRRRDRKTAYVAAKLRWLLRFGGVTSKASTL